MKILITGGGGFIGSRLACALLARGQLGGQPIERIVLADQVAPRAELTRDPRVEARVGALRGAVRGARQGRLRRRLPSRLGGSGECEADFDLGLRSNLDTTRALLDALRAATRPRRQAGEARLLELGRGVRPRSLGAAAAARRRRHAAGAEDLVRHAQADVRAPDRRLFEQGLHRRPLGATDDGDGAARPAERRGVVVLLGDRSRAARRRRGDLPRLARRLASADVGGTHRRRADRGLRSERRAARRPPRAQPAGRQRDGRRDARGARGSRRTGRARAGPLRSRRDDRRHRRQLAARLHRAARGAPRPACRQGLRRHHPPVHRRLPRRRRRRRSR